MKDVKILHHIGYYTTLLFASIGKSLATSISDDNNNDKFLNYLKNPCSSSIYLQSTSPQEVINLINSLKSNKAGGHDDILPIF